MSNALAISPAVMINRIADREGAPKAMSLVKVAELRLELMQAQDDEQQKADLLNPEGQANPLPLSSGAIVDRLI